MPSNPPPEPKSPVSTREKWLRVLVWGVIAVLIGCHVIADLKQIGDLTDFY